MTEKKNSTRKTNGGYTAIAGPNGTASVNINQESPSIASHQAIPDTHLTSSSQTSFGDYSAVAGPGGIATVNVTKIYQHSQPQPIDSETLAKAEERVAKLPFDEIPLPSQLPEGSRMPLPANPLFVGRENNLKAIARCFKRDQDTGQIGVVTGLGGVGKTQLVAEFVHRYGRYFAGGVFWLSFTDPAAIPADVVACGGPGGLDLRADFESLPLEEQVRRVLAAWQSPLPRLLIFDNCEDSTHLAQWRPPVSGCRILVTSRSSTWDVTLGVKVIPLGVLERLESLALLKKYRPDIRIDTADLGTIADELGDLPLAIHLAGSFLTSYRHIVTPAAYLSQLREQTLLNHPSLQGRGAALSPTDHDLHVGRTFALSYDRLDVTNAIDAFALAILARIGYLAPGELIPRYLIFNTLDIMEDDFETKLQAEDAISRLVTLGLLEEGIGGAMRQHSLLTAFTRIVSGEDFTAQYSVENALITIFQHTNEFGIQSEARPLEPHFRNVTELALMRQDDQAILLCNVFGNYLRRNDELSAAKFYLERALEMRETRVGQNHPDSALEVNDLGYILLQLSDYKNSQSYLERAFNLFNQKQDYPNAAATLDNLGQLFSVQGKYESAQENYQRALEIREKILGMKHPRTTITLHNLGQLFLSQGKISEALDYHERALKIRQQVLGGRNPFTAVSHHSLGFVFEAKDDLNSAVDNYERAFTNIQQAKGSLHPSTILYLSDLVRALVLTGTIDKATAYFYQLTNLIKENEECLLNSTITLNNVGLTLWNWGDYYAARRFYENAMGVDESRGDNLSRTHQVTLNNLAMVVAAFGDYETARRHYEEAFKIQEYTGKVDTTFMARLNNNLGMLLTLQGEINQAKTLLEKALKIRQEIHGIKHRATTTTLINLGLLLKSEGNYPEARKYIELALSTCKQMYGDKHPEIARSLNDLGALLNDQGKFQEAQKYLERALSMREQTLPEQHPHTADTLFRIGLVHLNQGQIQSARKHLERALEICQLRYGNSHPLTIEIKTNLDSL